MHKSILAIVVFASAATFRRAGHGFTDKGTAFVADHFSEQQRAAIEAEPRLSVKEMPEDAIPDGVDRAPLEIALAAQTTQKTEPKSAGTENRGAEKSGAKPSRVRHSRKRRRQEIGRAHV